MEFGLISFARWLLALRAYDPIAPRRSFLVFLLSSLLDPRFPLWFPRACRCAAVNVVLDTKKVSETMAVGEDEKASIIWTGTGLREEVGIGRLSLRKVNL